MLKITALALLAVGLVAVASVLIVAARKPDTFRVHRSARIQAPADLLFGHINDLHRWQAWSPYEKLDPAMKRVFTGPPAGPGAGYEWDGNGNVGAGRIEIRDAAEPSRVAISLVMTRPFACDNAVEFTLVPEGDATTVTWSMEGRSHFLSKLVGVFIDMDRMVAGQFDEGLANLKSIAEQTPVATAGGGGPR